jgi:hypothetical protein
VQCRFPCIEVAGGTHGWQCTALKMVAAPELAEGGRGPRGPGLGHKVKWCWARMDKGSWVSAVRRKEKEVGCNGIRAES